MLVVSISGCVGLPGFESLFGGTGPTVEQSADIITTESIRIIPNPPVLSGNEFTLMFTLKNQDAIQSVENVVVRLYNWGVCAPKLETFLPTGWEVDGNTYTNTFAEFGPQEEQVIELNFVAPDNSKTGNMEADCPIKWEVNYDFTAVTQDDFIVISKTRQRELDQNSIVWAGTDQAQYVGIGPIKIYFNFKTPMPVQATSTIQFSLQIEDKGTGLYSKVNAGTMELKVPKEWIDTSSTFEDINKLCTSNFEVVTIKNTNGLVEGTDYITVKANNIKIEDGYVAYVNAKDINIYDRNSAENICNFKAPDLDAEDIPEKSYFVSATIAGYEYKIPNEQAVHIKPSV